MPFDEGRCLPVRSASASLVHDISTPLATMGSIGATLVDIMPTLLAAYAEAIGRQGSSVVPLSRDRQELLAEIGLSLQSEAARAQTLVREFWKRIDAAVPDENPPGEPVAERLLSSVPDRQGAAGAQRAGRVLLVDDDPTNLDVASDILEALGCVADQAPDAAQAVLRALDNAYDLILLDCRMPGRDGYDAVPQIRLATLSQGVRTPIVGLTASPASEDRARGLEAGMDDVLVKPVTFALLRGLLERFVQPRREDLE